MRDLILVLLTTAGCLMALRQPWVGVLTWTWLSLMNPHRYTYGFAYSAPLAAAAAAATLIGLLITRDKTSPFKGSPVTAFTLFCLVITVSWLVGLDPAGDYDQWAKVMKINLMILVALALIHTRQQIMLLMWVVVMSLALLGTKGGLFTLASGGSYRVWGPPGSFIEDNNEFALALVITIPLLRFLQMQVRNKWLSRALLASMVLCAAASLGSHSRGALLAIGAMAVFLWIKGKNKLGMGLALLLAGVLLIAFMPEEWSARMHTIDNYQDDRSAMGRISAWWTAWNLAFVYPFGVGFQTARAELFAQFSPYPDYIHAAHSIYFQVLGNHGFPGLIVFLSIWITTWRSAAWILKEAPKHEQARWCVDLAAMCQVALVAYAVGGAFLSLAYFDVPYNIMIAVVTARLWVQQRAWEKEPATVPRWQALLGVGEPPPEAETGKKKARAS